MSLTIEHFSDRELINLVIDHAADDGWVNTVDLAEILGLAVNGSKGAVSIGLRFSYLKRIGMMEREERLAEGETLKRWRLTQLGEQYGRGHLRAAAQKQLDKLDDQALLEVTTFLTDRYRQIGGGGATLMRREWRYGTSKLRWE